MRENELRHALNASVDLCQPSDHWKNHLVRQIVAGEKAEKKLKLSVGLVVAIVLILLSIVALAVTMLTRNYTEKIAEMDASGALTRWELQDKITFVNAMKENGFDIDPSDYEIMTDASLPDEQREAAADRIVDRTYGELIRAQLGYYIVEDGDSLGIAPDPVIIFEERYLAEHPEGIETHDQFRDYMDALGYWLRDEYYPSFQKALEDRQETPESPEPVTVDEAYAVQRLRDYMTEVLGWDPAAVAEMTPVVEWDETYRVWTVSGEVSSASMENVTDLRKGQMPSLEGLDVEKTESGYKATVMVDDQGNQSMETLDKAAFSMLRDEITDTVMNIGYDQAILLAEEAVQEKYQLSREAVRKYFSFVTPVGVDADNRMICRIDLMNHYAVDQKKIYGVIVNQGTGTVEAVFDYSFEGDPLWELLAFAAEKETAEGSYVRWQPESKRQLAERIRRSGLLADHAYWRLENPSEADTDALVAEAFHRKGYASTVNVMGMADAMFGPAESWSREVRSKMEYLQEEYYIRAEMIMPVEAADSTEISRDDAARIVRAAVCQAWGMPEDAMDAWTAVVQLVQMNTDQGGTALYRVFLTRPDSELGQNTFGGKDNFNYRIFLDGTIPDSSVNPSWRSPAEDR